jgi:glycosyltransferase involved in cell wall biosynthesis
LIRAFQALQPAGWKLVLVGGDDSQNFKAQLLGLASGNSNILFTGQLLGAHLAEIMRGAGVCVLPSNVEGLPMSMLEAMAEGVPIVASNIPPHQQLLSHDRGVLFRRGSLDSCIETIDWAIGNRQELEAIAKRAELYVHANYNWEQITTRLLDVYEAMLKQSKVSAKRVTPANTNQSDFATLTEVGKNFPSTDGDDDCERSKITPLSEVNVPYF